MAHGPASEPSADQLVHFIAVLEASLALEPVTDWFIAQVRLKA
jgi:hypothetical protein